jgi:outer membrane lipoprotein-sorting protein
MVIAAALSAATPPVAAPTDARASPLADAIVHFQMVESYRVTVHSFHADGEEHIRYAYRKPGYVRMEFIKPHSGALLIYSPQTRRVRLWPFGFGHIPEFDLSPGNALIRSSRGQHVDHSDVGALFENIRALEEHGHTELVGEEKLDGRAVLHLRTTGAGNSTAEGVHGFDWWLDTATLFPVKVISHDANGAVLETVVMEGLEINPLLPENLFNP